jgi:hypothetical protein
MNKIIILIAFIFCSLTSAAQIMPWQIQNDTLGANRILMTDSIGEYQRVSLSDAILDSLSLVGTDTTGTYHISIDNDLDMENELAEYVASGVEPDKPKAGDFWLDTNAQELFIYDGTSYVFLTRDFTNLNEGEITFEDVVTVNEVGMRSNTNFAKLLTFKGIEGITIDHSLNQFTFGIDSTLITDDQNASEVPFTSYLSITSANTQLAIEELKDEVDAVVAGGGDLLGTDGDKGDITVGGSGTTLQIDAAVITEAELNASINTSLDLADSALQTEVDGSITNEIQDLSGINDSLVTLFDTLIIYDRRTAGQVPIDQDILNAFADDSLNVWRGPQQYYLEGIHNSIDFRAKYMHTGDSIRYVSKEGDDSDGLTMATAYNTIYTALLDSVDIIYVDSGIYDYNQSILTAINSDLSIIGINGNVYCGRILVPRTWIVNDNIITSIDGFSLNDAMVFVKDEYDELGVLKKLNEVADEATCKLTPNSYANNGSEIHINYPSTTVADIQSDLIISIGYGGAIRDNAPLNLYLENLHIFGAHSYNDANTRVGVNNCQILSTINTTDEPILSSITNGIHTALYHTTIAYSSGDGANYKGGSTGYEIDCTFAYNGSGVGAQSNQNSTAHTTSKVIRVNSEYYFAQTANIYDINAGTKSLNAGITLNGINANYPSPTIQGSLVSDAAIIWADGVKLGGGYPLDKTYVELNGGIINAIFSQNLDLKQ